MLTPYWASLDGRVYCRIRLLLWSSTFQSWLWMVCWFLGWELWPVRGMKVHMSFENKSGYMGPQSLWALQLTWTHAYNIYLSWSWLKQVWKEQSHRGSSKLAGFACWTRLHGLETANGSLPRTYSLQDIGPSDLRVGIPFLNLSPDTETLPTLQ